MSKFRTTVSIVDLIEKVNKLNRESTYSREHRIGVNTFLENILHQNKVYAGFGYLTIDKVPKGQLPGIVRKETLLQPGEHHEFPDDSRIVYFYHRRLPPSKE